MEPLILETITHDFNEYDRAAVIAELSSITLDHVMASSEYNLMNTRMAVLKLAKGDLNQITELTKSAKFDFRDVIMWAIQDKR